MIPTDRNVRDLVEDHLRAVMGEAWRRPHSLEVARELHLTRPGAANGGPRESRASLRSRPLVQSLGRSRAEKMLAAVEALDPAWRRPLELFGAGCSQREIGKVLGCGLNSGRLLLKEALAAARMWLATN